MSICLNSNNVPQDYRETIVCCSKALDIDAKSTKALYLRSVARMKLGEFDLAITDCRDAIKLAP